MKPIELRLEGEKVWRCRQCSHEQSESFQCKKCGNVDFDGYRKDIPADAPRSVYEVLSNILIQGQHLDKGVLVVLPEDFFITKQLLVDKTIKFTNKKRSTNKARAVLSRKIGNTKMKSIVIEGKRDSNGKPKELNESEMARL